MRARAECRDWRTPGKQLAVVCLGATLCLVNPTRHSDATSQRHLHATTAQLRWRGLAHCFADHAIQAGLTSGVCPLPHCERPLACAKTRTWTCCQHLGTNHELHIAIVTDWSFWLRRRDGECSLPPTTLAHALRRRAPESRMLRGPHEPMMLCGPIESRRRRTKECLVDDSHALGASSFLLVSDIVRLVLDCQCQAP